MILIKNIFAIIIGHFTVLKHAFKNRITRQYPEQRQKLPEKFRGLPKWDFKKCISCKMCEKVCPSAAIQICKTDSNINYKLDLNKCIFCGNCSYYCPKNAIEMSNEYELASDKKSSLYIEINSLNSTN